MSTASALKALQDRIATINDLLNAISVLTWDSRTMMPPGGAQTRGLQISTLTGLALEQLLSPQTEAALAAAEEAAQVLPVDSIERTMVDQVRHAVSHHRRIPATLTQERAALRTVAQAAWIEARGRSDFSIFAPLLEKTVGLARRYADYVGWQEHPYDAMVALYEPGETASSLTRLFGILRDGLRPILSAARVRPACRRDFLFRDYPEPLQRSFGLFLAERLGYDLQRGRLDTTVHPFEVSFTREDVRITTRYRRDYLPASLFGTAHETGHALYEQGVDPAYTRTVIASDLVGLYAVGGTSFGAHESQSRLWENHVVRSLAFWRLHFSELQTRFPEQLADVTADEFYAAVTHAEPGFIRVEADELSYDMHVMLRVEIECALMDGSLSVPDLPGAWNAAVQRDLGLTVPNDALGMLQDVHWSTGYIGSFASYTIGNVMAAQVMAALQDKDANLAPAINAGDYLPLKNALRQAIWQHGRRFGREELLVRTTGRGLDPAPYLAYLRNKYAPQA